VLYVAIRIVVHHQDYPFTHLPKAHSKQIDRGCRLWAPKCTTRPDDCWVGGLPSYSVICIYLSLVTLLSSSQRATSNAVSVVVVLCLPLRSGNEDDGSRYLYTACWDCDRLEPDKYDRQRPSGPAHLYRLPSSQQLSRNPPSVCLVLRSIIYFLVLPRNRFKS